MQRQPDFAERVARIEEKMATRDELDEFRALVERRTATARWFGGAASVALIGIGFVALVLVFAR